jgi:hypothetical protein
MNTTGYFFKSFNFDAAGQPIAYRYLPIRKKNEKKKDVYTDYPISVIFQKNGFIFYNQELTPSGYKPQRILSFLNFDDFSDNIPVLQDYHEEKMDFASVYEKHDLYKNTEVLTYKNTFPSIPNEKTENTLIHQVFLDFLFDFFHSNVFSTNSYYENIKNRLQTHELTKALIAKADYYYHRNLQDDQLETATKTWLSLIRNKDYEKIIHPDNKWFEPIESEHFNVFYQGEEPKFKYPFLNDIAKSLILLFTRKKSDIEIFLAVEAETSVQWLLERYHLWGAFVLQFGYIFSIGRNIIIAIGFFLLLIFDLFNLTTLTVHLKSFYELLNASSILSSKGYISCFLVFATKMFLYFLAAVFIENIVYGIACLFKSILGIVNKFIAYVFIAVFLWFFTSFLLYLFAGMSFKISNETPYCFALPCFWLYLSLSEKLKFSPSRNFAEWLLSIPKLIQFFKPKILLASAVVWTAVFTSERFWNLNLHIGLLEMAFLFFLGICSYSFMVAKFKPLLPIKDRRLQAWKIFRRASFIGLLGVIYSFLIGISTMSFSAENILTKDDFLKDYFSAYYEGDSIGENYKNRLDATTQKELDAILSVQKPNSNTKNVNKQLFDTVLDSLKHPTDINRKVMYKATLVGMERKELKELYQRNLYIFPDMLLFYTFITLLIGIFAEMGFGKQE